MRDVIIMLSRFSSLVVNTPQTFIKAGNTENTSEASSFAGSRIKQFRCCCCLKFTIRTLAQWRVCPLTAKVERGTHRTVAGVEILLERAKGRGIEF